MKKLILLLLFIPLVSFGQDFRKMNFGDSKKKLYQIYPDVEFDIEYSGLIEFFSHFDYIAGIKTRISYVFLDNELSAGMYMFSENNNRKGGDERLRDFKTVSDRLNIKYDMENIDEWHKTTWKDVPNWHGYALSNGEVSFGERYENERFTIFHSLEYISGYISHNVVYGSSKFNKWQQEELNNQF